MHSVTMENMKIEHDNAIEQSEIVLSCEIVDRMESNKHNKSHSPSALRTGEPSAKTIPEKDAGKK